MGEMGSNSDFVFILEAGVNHDGDFEEAIELVREAAKTGAHYIKFQTYSADKIAAPESPSYWDLSEEPTNSQIELFSKYDGLTKENYKLLAEEAEGLGIGFMTTCFDKDWVNLLDEIIPQYKVASADITNFSLLSEIAKKNKGIVLSTGAATFSEIHAAIELIRRYSGAPVALLHCVLNYPTSASNAALGRINALKIEFPEHIIGYSDHTKPSDSFQAIQIAYDFGARVFEKHFTLKPQGKGNDHYHSFTTKDAVLAIEALIRAQSLTSFEETSFIANQESARKFARRGIYATRTLLVGDVLDESSLIPLRPSVGPNGFGGEEFFNLIGRRVSIKVEEGSAIQRNFLE
jgi:N-acetylneuraminate synthase